MASVIKDTFYRDFFSGEENNIFLLDEKSAVRIWETYIDKSAGNYFHLADNHWLCQSKQHLITSWISDFNNEISSRVKEKLEQALIWKEEDIIWFCINKYTIIESVWAEFKQKWISFLYCEDDAPIILNKLDESKILIARPVGDFVFIARPHADKMVK